MIKTTPLVKAAEGYAKMMTGKARAFEWFSPCNRDLEEAQIRMRSSNVSMNLVASITFSLFLITVPR